MIVMLEKNKQITSIAINTINKNILVSASAGAGKTKLLIDRLIKRITLDNIEVSEILALTFTDAAAYEMKHRLQQAIAQKLQEETTPFLRKQLSLIETASISTIHSFCLSIVKDYSYVLDLDPSMVNNLLDEATKSFMIDACVEEVIQEEIKENDPSFSDLVDHLCERSQNLDPLKKAIKDIMVVRLSKVNPTQWDQDILLFYNEIQRINELPKNILALIQESYHVDLQQLEQLTVQLIHIYSRSNDEESIEWKSIQNELKNCTEHILNGNFDEVNRKLISIALVKTPTIKDHEEYKKTRERFNKLIKGMVEGFHDESVLTNDLHLQKPLIAKLLSLTERLMMLYQENKVEDKVMDFDDMEKYAFAILNHPKYDVADQYKERFKDVLIDEFQDTNDIQHAIINRVSRDTNVFRVGDIKQSIYRFRNANPQLMRELINSQSPNNIVLVLPNNFRSSEDIVSFNNHVFSQLMNIETFSDIYNQDDLVSIGLEKQISKNIPVELDIIDADVEEVKTSFDEESDEQQESIDYDDTTKEGLLKARHIAKRIVDLHAQGYNFKDICILVKTHKTKLFLKDVFDEINIPYFIDTKSGFFLSQPIQDVLSFMRVIKNPYDNISFIGLMKSAFFNLSFDEISEVSLTNKPNKLPYYDAFKHSHPLIIEAIEAMITTSTNRSLVDVLHSIYQFNDFYQEHCDEQAKINLDYLLDKAFVIDKQNKHSIHYFLSIIQNLQDEISSEALPVSSDADVVRVMTIHQSKGLQFPVVFFWTNNLNRIMDLTEKVVVDSKLGIGLHTIKLPFKFKRPNILRQAIEFHGIKEELQEQIRLLYVGLTRAESLMICVALPSKESLTLPIDQNMVYRRKGNGHWLSAIFMQSQEEFMKTNIVAPTTSLPLFKKKEEPSEAPKPTIKQVKSIEKDETFYTPSLFFEPYLKSSEKGSIIHEVLSKIVEKNFDVSRVDLMSNLDSTMKEQIIEWLENTFTTSFKNSILNSEFPIIMQIDDYYQQGYIDLLIQKEDANIVVDFKSDRVDSKDELIRRHQQQLKNYAYAIKHIFPNKEVQIFIYSLHLNCYIEI